MNSTSIVTPEKSEKRRTLVDLFSFKAKRVNVDNTFQTDLRVLLVIICKDVFEREFIALFFRFLRIQL